MRFSQRVLRQAESATMAVARKAAEMRRAGSDLIDLGAGEPSLDSPDIAVEAAIAALRDGCTRYTAVDGPADLRSALAAHYAAAGAPWSGEGDVLVTVGAKAALLQTICAVVDEGSEVVVPAPVWPTIPAQVRIAGGEPVLVAMEAEGGFQLRAEPLLRACTERTRAIVLNSPCNPTGAVMAPAELRRLATGCEQRGLLLISDETYGAFIYGEGAGPWEHSVASLAAEFSETVVLVSSFSKVFAMTGWRVGYALGSPGTIGACRSLQGHMTSNATSFAMAGALAALERGAAFRRDHVAHCRRNRSLADAVFSGPEFDYASPSGAFYAFPGVDLSRCAGGLFPSTAALAEHLLTEHALVVVPGEAFGAPGRLRISLAGSSRKLGEGLEVLQRALSGSPARAVQGCQA